MMNPGFLEGVGSVGELWSFVEIISTAKAQPENHHRMKKTSSKGSTNL